jgi:hypothetical protein
MQRHSTRLRRGQGRTAEEANDEEAAAESKPVSLYGLPP